MTVVLDVASAATNIYGESLSLMKVKPRGGLGDSGFGNFVGGFAGETVF